VDTKGFKKRFGTEAVEKGYVTLDQLMGAVRAQIKDNLEDNKHRRIGEILFECGHITTPQIDDVLISLGKNLN
jgi:hypothetical protein